VPSFSTEKKRQLLNKKLSVTGFTTTTKKDKNSNFAIKHWVRSDRDHREPDPIYQ
jgi:hypothetical protein